MPDELSQAGQPLSLLQHGRAQRVVVSAGDRCCDHRAGHGGAADADHIAEVAVVAGVAVAGMAHDVSTVGTDGSSGMTGFLSVDELTNNRQPRPPPSY